MPLLLPVLQRAVTDVFRNRNVRDGATAARLLSQAYFLYAATAASAYGPFTPTGTEVVRLQAMLRSALSSPVGAVTSISSAWGRGLLTFWVGAVFGTGVALPLPGVGLVQSQVSASLLVLGNTADSAALGLATALDAGTRTLTIGGMSGPVPVT